VNHYENWSYLCKDRSTFHALTKLFLVATKRLYMSFCQFVGRSVCLSLCGQCAFLPVSLDFCTLEIHCNIFIDIFSDNSAIPLRITISEPNDRFKGYVHRCFSNYKVLFPYFEFIVILFENRILHPQNLFRLWLHTVLSILRCWDLYISRQFFSITNDGLLFLQLRVYYKHEKKKWCSYFSN
jgi:phosphoglycerol transferase MdoB-like AlkP superfamily enzyme